jgi:hypothetical protein
VLIPNKEKPSFRCTFPVNKASITRRHRSRTKREQQSKTATILFCSPLLVQPRRFVHRGLWAFARTDALLLPLPLLSASHLVKSARLVEKLDDKQFKTSRAFNPIYKHLRFNCRAPNSNDGLPRKMSSCNESLCSSFGISKRHQDMSVAILSIEPSISRIAFSFSFERNCVILRVRGARRLD